MLYGEASQKQEATEDRREVRVISCEEFWHALMTKSRTIRIKADRRCC